MIETDQLQLAAYIHAECVRHKKDEYLGCTGNFFRFASDKPLSDWAAEFGHAREKQYNQSLVALQMERRKEKALGEKVMSEK